MLGGLNESDPPYVNVAFLGQTCFVERPLGENIQVIAYQRDPLTARIASVQQMRDFLSPIVLGAARSGYRLSTVGDRLNKDKDAHRPLPFVFIVDPLRMLPSCRDRHTRLTNELHCLLVHAHDAADGIGDFVLRLQHLFDVRYKLTFRIGNNYPILAFPLSDTVLLASDEPFLG